MTLVASSISERIATFPCTTPISDQTLLARYPDYLPYGHFVNVSNLNRPSFDDERMENIARRHLEQIFPDPAQYLAHLQYGNLEHVTRCSISF